MRRFLLTHTFFLIALIFPVFGHAADLVNINTADAALLETLPGIGATKAASIVEYRTDHGLFAKKSDIQNVSGIGASTYAQIEPLITVGDSTSEGKIASTEEVATDSVALQSSSGAIAVYQPPGNKLTVHTEADFVATLHVPHHFSAYAKTASGLSDAGAILHWSFGDGSDAFGSSVDKTFAYAGTYVVTVTATDGLAKGTDSVTVTVEPASVRIDSVSSAGVMIANDTDILLDLSGWRISTEQGFFKIPDGTEIFPNRKVLFPWSNVNLPVAFRAQLSYPSGLVAATYAPPETLSVPVVQPEASEKSSHRVQTAATVAITNQSQTVHEAAGALAPAVTTQMAAAGAALPAATQEEDASQKGGISAIVSSPWTLGFLGVLAVSIGAFILL